jgi:hypothetical protein
LEEGTHKKHRSKHFGRPIPAATSRSAVSITPSAAITRSSSGQYDAFRYSREGHILGCLDGIDFRGAKLLEIGLGQGADSEQIIRRGAR